MDDEAEGDNKRLNRLVAATVVILSVFMAISKIKDDNIVQAMQKAKSESVDAWAEYQAARIKLHVEENSMSMLRVFEPLGIDKALAAKQIGEYEADIKKYQARSAETMKKAKDLEAEYDRLNSATTSSTCRTRFSRSPSRWRRSRRSLSYSGCWPWPGVGCNRPGCSGIAGFAGVNLRPEWLAQLLGT